jgi:hypothetical protein
VFVSVLARGQGAQPCRTLFRETLLGETLLGETLLAGYIGLRACVLFVNQLAVLRANAMRDEQKVCCRQRLTCAEHHQERGRKQADPQHQVFGQEPAARHAPSLGRDPHNRQRLTQRHLPAAKIGACSDRAGPCPPARARMYPPALARDLARFEPPRTSTRWDGLPMHELHRVLTRSKSLAYVLGLALEDLWQTLKPGLRSVRTQNRAQHRAGPAFMEPREGKLR